MNELPRTLKLVTVWLLILTAGWLAALAWQRHQNAPRVQALAGTVTLQRGPDGHFHWPARLQARRVSFLVDTGATTTAIPQALADDLGLPRGQALRSSTAGGDAQGWETRADLTLEGGLVLTGWRVVVLPRLDVPLLGMDVLSRLHYSQSGGELRLQTDGAP